MKIVREFSRFADEYTKHNIIQSKVASHLIEMLSKNHYRKALDLGSGSGSIYEKLIKSSIKIDDFIAFDFSKNMLDLHPSYPNISKICADFNDEKNFISYNDNEFNLIISSSALQWSSDLDSIFASISHLSNEYYFSFFTSNTFKTLHKTASIESPIYSKEIILKALNKYFLYEFEVISYRLDFTSVHEMLRYIKRTGVSGGVGKLNYKEIKNLMKNYPLEYLEFEALFIKAVKK